MDPSDDNLRLLGHLISRRLTPAAIDAGAWPAIVTQAQKHRLGPMLYWRLKQNGSESLPESLWQQLREGALKVAKVYLLLDLARHQIQTALAEIDVPCVWFKGSVLAPAIYPHPALRPMGDLDFLVPYAQRNEALAAVEALRYVRLPDDLFGDVRHHYHLAGGRANLVHVELHYWLLGRDHSELLPEEQLRWFWSQTQEIECAPGDTLLTFTPEAHLLYLCAHALLQHGEARMRLLHFLDLNYLVEHTAPDWDLLVEKAVELRWSYAVEQALQKSIAFFATPVPEHVISTLRQKRTPADFVERVRILQGKGFQFEHFWRTMGELSLPGKLRQFYRHLLPPRAYMRWRYQVPTGRPVWPHYLRRWYGAGQSVLNAIRLRLRLLLDQE